MCTKSAKEKELSMKSNNIKNFITEWHQPLIFFQATAATKEQFFSETILKGLTFFSSNGPSKKNLLDSGFERENQKNPEISHLSFFLSDFKWRVISNLISILLVRARMTKKKFLKPQKTLFDDKESDWGCMSAFESMCVCVIEKEREFDKPVNLWKRYE